MAETIEQIRRRRKQEQEDLLRAVEDGDFRVPIETSRDQLAIDVLLAEIDRLNEGDHG